MILDSIAQSTKIRVAQARLKCSFDEVRRQAEALPVFEPFRFERELRKGDFSFICEVKKASPSKGIIAQHFPYQKIAKEYEAAGAAAISVLTEPDYFLGCDRYLKEIRAAVSIPLLRKDFVIDSYQIYEAKLLGADCVLLICALLDTETLRDYLQICRSLGLSALVETHNETEIASALEAGAGLLGINNRDLKTFHVDVTACTALRDLVPPDVFLVAESGITSSGDIASLRQANIHAALIGETLMRATDKKAKLAELLGEAGA